MKISTIFTQLYEIVSNDWQYQHLSYLHIGFHLSCLHNDHSHHTTNPLHLCIYLYSYIISHHCCMMDLQKESLIMIVRQSNEASLFYHGLKSGYMIVIPFLVLPFLMRPLSLIHGSPVTEQAKAQQRRGGGRLQTAFT